MAEINESISYITCSCEERFQVLNEDQTDCDNRATAISFYTHVLDCKNSTDREEAVVFYYYGMNSIYALNLASKELKTEIEAALKKRDIAYEEAVQPQPQEPVQEETAV